MQPRETHVTPAAGWGGAKWGRTAALRVTFVSMGILAIGFAAAMSVEFVARCLSSDGQISQLGYVWTLRAIGVATGGALVVFGLVARRSHLENGLLAMLSLALTGAALEGSLRAWESWSETADSISPGLRVSAIPELAYENAPNFIEFGELKFNSLGMRDDERPFIAGRRTIVVVGDSIEAWRGLPAAELYPRRLEAKLNAREKTDPVQVVNLGVSGYSLRQKIEMLQRRGLGWHPDVAVVGYCLNDPIPALELVNYFEGRRWRPAIRSVSWFSTLFRTAFSTAFYRFGIDFYRAVHDPRSEDWKSLVHDFGALGALAHDKHLPIVVLIFPLMPDSSIGYRWADVHVRVADVALASGLRVVDLLDSYRAAGSEMVRADAVHPNALGHQIAADRLYDAIVAVEPEPLAAAMH